jgi:hypothetical protein
MLEQNLYNTFFPQKPAAFNYMAHRKKLVFNIYSFAKSPGMFRDVAETRINCGEIIIESLKARPAGVSAV